MSDHAQTASNLDALIGGFAASGMMALGAIPDPDTQQTYVSLPVAKHSIDMLLMLRDKTRGNLSETESRSLDSIIARLELRFAETARG